VAGIIHCSTIIIEAQPVQQEWIRRYPDSLGGYGEGKAITTDNLGSIYVTGMAILNSHYNYCTIKYNIVGEVKWMRLYAGNYGGGRAAIGVVIDESLNVFVTGYSWQLSNNFDFVTIKYDSSGNEKWVKYYNNPLNGEDGPTAIAIDNVGNVYITGFSSYGGNNYVYCTIKYNTLGDLIWERDFGQPSASAGANAIAVDERCNVYITGMSSNHAITVSYDSSGNLRWSQIYYGTFGSQANALALDKDANVFVTGQSAESTGYQYFTVKYSSSGVQQWMKLYAVCDSLGYVYFNAPYSIHVDNSNNILIFGGSANGNGTHKVFCTIKYSNYGDSIWTVIRPQIALGPHPAMYVDSYCSIYMTAAVPDSINNHGGYFTFKYDSSGHTIWTTYYNSHNYSLDSSPEGIISDQLGNVYVTGFASESNFSNQTDLCTIKYSQPLYGIKRISNQIPERFKLYQNYPNPFNSVTIIIYELPIMSYVKLIIYDILGKEVATIVNQKQNTGKYQVEWDASSFSSGVYFYSLEYDGGRITKKLVLLK
jgi:hypothetical protein